MSFDEHIARALQRLERDHLLRAPRVVAGPQGPELCIDGRTVIGLCSNDYLGIAADPRLAEPTCAALARAGLGSGASRHICGTSELHHEAERRLARFVGRPRALLFSSGYAANVGSLQALMGPRDVIFSDALNHASLIDGCRLSRATVHVYRHADPEHLQALLSAHRSHHENALVVSESLFSMDADEAPLPALRELADGHDAGLLLDEAHALGVLGPGGRGLAAAAGITPDLLVGTLGKAFGCSGAFVAASAPTAQLIENRARSYVFSTAPPPALAAATLAATDLVAQADDRRARVLAHAARLRDELSRLELRVLPGRAPIIPVIVGDARRTTELSARLLEQGVFVHGIRPPTVAPGTSRLRVTPIATHTDAQLDRALDAFRRVLSLAHV